MTTNYDPQKYASLLVGYLSGVITTEEENERAIEFAGQLMKKGARRSPEETHLLDLLVTLIEDFEEKAYPMGVRSEPPVALRELMREHELKQTDTVEIFGSQGVVSQVLNGKREISKAQAGGCQNDSVCRSMFLFRFSRRANNRVFYNIHLSRRSRRYICSPLCKLWVQDQQNARAVENGGIITCREREYICYATAFDGSDELCCLLPYLSIRATNMSLASPIATSPRIIWAEVFKDNESFYAGI